jgi:hypothetical protein
MEQLFRGAGRAARPTARTISAVACRRADREKSQLLLVSPPSYHDVQTRVSTLFPTAAMRRGAINLTNSAGLPVDHNQSGLPLLNDRFGVDMGRWRARRL